MRMIGWTVAAALLLGGCTGKEHDALLTHYEKNKYYHKQLIKTEKVQLYEGDLTKVALTATYLNTYTPDKNVTEDERFIIGLYIDEESSDVSGYEFNLTLNGQPPLRIVPLKEGDKRLKDISFVSDWAHFFLVDFPHQSAKRLTLVFESERYGKGTLHFAKQAKYVFTKKAFD